MSTLPRLSALILVAVSLAITGCPSSTSQTVADPNQMTPEQEAEQQAYLEQMDQ
ncbi:MULTISPECIES: hypothetical protein [Rhodopirellula]|jgi:outer membrane PBP1 activator LpoA protein|uniref:hypothetical protein n=1 Tax=Rhodopirellula TaxID=265488 RepID=UPI0003479B09|nr:MULTISPECIES: hypothetical protein [Rhodopirellula]MCR9211670.1 hypothetical protein [bacterium]